MASQTPAIDIQNLLSDARWPAYRDLLVLRCKQLEYRLAHGTLDHAAMCRLAGELRGLHYALGAPALLADSDPRSD